MNRAPSTPHGREATGTRAGGPEIQIAAREITGRGSGPISFAGPTHFKAQNSRPSAAAKSMVNFMAAFLTVSLPHLFYGGCTPCQDAQRGGNSPPFSHPSRGRPAGSSPNTHRRVFPPQLRLGRSPFHRNRHLLASMDHRPRRWQSHGSSD